MTSSRQVKFRDDFSAALVGVVWEVDGPESEAAGGRTLVPLRTVFEGQFSTRLAWADDLCNLDGSPYVA